MRVRARELGGLALGRPVGTSAARGKAKVARAADLSRVLKAIGAQSIRRLDLKSTSRVAAVAEAVQGAQLKQLVAGADGTREARRLMAEAPWAARMAKLEAGDHASVPALALRPGQTQLSFDHAVPKMAKLARKILERKPSDVSELFGKEDFPVVVGPDGQQAILRDGHHKLTAILGLSALVHGMLGTGTAASSHTALGVGKEWRKLAEVIPPPTELEVPVYVAGQEAGIAAGDPPARREADFLSVFDDPNRYSPLYLTRRDGSVASVPPRRISELEDNPFRKLAAELVGKFSWGKDGAPKLDSKNPSPLWLKGPDAPEFVEFYLAEVLEAACRDKGFAYEPGQALSPGMLGSFREALAAAQDAEHPILQKVIAFEGEVAIDDLGGALKLLRDVALDFDAAQRPADGAIPIAILPSGAPDVHRIHAAARLLDALHEEGLEPESAVVTPELLKDVIRRLDRVHDDVGLWVNTAARTTAELARDARLAQGLGLKLEPHKKSKLRPDGALLPRPLWVEAPGVPNSASMVVGALLSDLFEKIGHDPSRLPEITAEARSRLIDAKVSPEHPFYDRAALVPVVVEGGVESIAASVRLGRKKRTLEFGHPVEQGSQPHVLAPRRHLRAPAAA